MKTLLKNFNLISVFILIIQTVLFGAFMGWLALAFKKVKGALGSAPQKVMKIDSMSSSVTSLEESHEELEQGCQASSERLEQGLADLQADIDARFEQLEQGLKSTMLAGTSVMAGLATQNFFQELLVQKVNDKVEEKLEEVLSEHITNEDKIREVLKRKRETDTPNETPNETPN